MSKRQLLSEIFVGFFISVTVLGIVVAIALGVHAGHVENTKQLASCVNGGGSWINDRNGHNICVMPGLSTSYAQGLTVDK